MVCGTYSIHCAVSVNAQTEIPNDSQHKVPVGEKYHLYNVPLFTWKLTVLHKTERKPNMHNRTWNVPVGRQLRERCWQVSSQKEILDNECQKENKRNMLFVVKRT